MMRMTCFAMALGLAACAAPTTTQDLDTEDLTPPSADGKAEAWDRANNPAYVDGTFLMHVSQLPPAGESAHRPISGDYWAVYKDGINARWDGPMSPAEKYARAFGKDVRAVQEAVSRANGVKAHADRPSCETDADCQDLEDGSACGASYDGAMKRCIPTWFGICHGWAPYAYMEPQAVTPVTRRAPDGTAITFYPSDLEALMSLLYTDIDSKFLSSRCELGAGDGNTVVTDNSGRVVHAACRDMNPGTWHVLVGNRVGLRREGFVLDQTLNYEVWNQPGWKYEIVNARGGELVEVSRAEATALVGGAGGGYPWNAEARRFFHVEMDFTFVVESQPSRTPRDAADFARKKRYSYVLETDENGKIFGGEWVGASKEEHPDFAWWATSTPSGEVSGIGYADVRGLNDEAAGAGAGDRETLLDDHELTHTFWTRSTYRTLNLPAGYRRVTLVMTGTGDARLMVGHKGKEPNLIGSKLCDANVDDTANQSCSFDVDPAGGPYHVRVRSEQEGTRVTLVATKIK